MVNPDALAFKRLIPEEESRKTISKVFDESTIQTLHYLSNQGYFEQVEFVISTGKEAHVFRAVDRAGNYRAIKIYKTLTSNFNHMMEYIQGDIRFKTTKRDKYNIVQTWTRKEYKNLALANQAGVRVPLPLTFKTNVLVMEFIGSKGEAAPTLKEKPFQDSFQGYQRVLENMKKLFQNAQLIHADLSEYNILNNNEEPVIIDIGQAVLKSHPNAKTFFERDVSNIARYFQKHNVSITPEKTSQEIQGSANTISTNRKKGKAKTDRPTTVARK